MLCPVCDSVDIKISERPNEVLVPFANPVYYNTKVCYCNSCGANIRLDGESQEEIESKIYKSSLESVPALLKDLNRRGFSDDRIDRALFLKSGTLKQWKEGKSIDPVVIALVRFMYMLPQLVVVAEEQYDVTKLFRI